LLILMRSREKRGREIELLLPRGFTTVLITCLLNGDLDLTGFGGLLLGEGDGQDAVFVLRRYLIVLDRWGDGEGADEVAIAALDTVIAFGAFVLFKLARALEGEGVVFDADVDFFGFDVREVGTERQGIFGFEDVDGGGPRTAAAGFIHQPGDGIFEEAEVLEGVKGDCGSAHGFVLVPFGEVLMA